MKFVKAAYLSAASLVFAVIAMPAWAQPIRPCDPKEKDPKTCVEFTVRYYKNPQKVMGYPSKDSKLIIVDPNAKDPKLATPPISCEIDKKNCKSAVKATINHLGTIQTLQTTINPECYLICIDGWCYEICY